MCHRIEFGDRLGKSRPTLPVADLLLSKLQIVKINRKDVLDALILLAEHPLGQDDGAPDADQGEGAINLPRILVVHLERLGLVADGDRQPRQARPVPRDRASAERPGRRPARPVRFDPGGQVAGAARRDRGGAEVDALEAPRDGSASAQQWYVEPEESGAPDRD